jgi:hypothetical protein
VLSIALIRVFALFQRTSSTEAAIVATTGGALPPRHRSALPANLDPETAEMVRMQTEDHGTDMFSSITPADDAEVERLMTSGYQYNDALLEIFNYRYPPLRSYSAYPSPMPSPRTPMSPPYYQPGAGMPSQYPTQAPPPYYGTAAQGYVSQQSFYMQPQGPQPVMHSRSFYQVPGPSYMVMPDGTSHPIEPDESGLYPTEYAAPRKPGHARKPSSGSNSGAGTGKPPVINGSQTLLEQRRQDAKRAAQVPNVYYTRAFERLLIRSCL